MSRPTTHKRPTGRGCFSWARVPRDNGFVIYRLFRRDMCRKLHSEWRCFEIGTPRGDIAQQLNTARHQLRDSVDAIDLEIMGVTQ